MRIAQCACIALPKRDALEWLMSNRATTSSTRQIAFRLPLDVAAELERLADLHGVTLVTLVVDALRRTMKLSMTIPEIPDKEKLARWMVANRFATGPGDTMEDLLRELEWQVEEIRLQREFYE